MAQSSPCTDPSAMSSSSTAVNAGNCAPAAPVDRLVDRRAGTAGRFLGSASAAVTELLRLAVDARRATFGFSSSSSSSDKFSSTCAMRQSVLQHGRTKHKTALACITHKTPWSRLPAHHDQCCPDPIPALPLPIPRPVTPVHCASFVPSPAYV